jgi:hypothetical protein
MNLIEQTAKQIQKRKLLQLQEKNITQDFCDANGREWEAELNVEYESGDECTSWCHLSTVVGHKTYCSSIALVEAFGYVEGDDDGDVIKVPTALFDEVHEWALEEGY